MMTKLDLQVVLQLHDRCLLSGEAVKKAFADVLSGADDAHSNASQFVLQLHDRQIITTDETAKFFGIEESERMIIAPRKKKSKKSKN